MTNASSKSPRGLPSHAEIALKSIDVFSGDGTIDLQKLNLLMDLALRDDHVDDEERRVLARVFNRIEEGEVSQLIWNRVRFLTRKYDLAKKVTTDD